MALTTYPFRTDVLNRLGQLPQKVYADQVPEDKEINWQDGLFDPFTVVFFGGPVRSAVDHHLTGTRNDTTLLYVTIEVNAPRADVAALIKDQIIDLLTGFRPTDCGEMVLEGGGQFSRSSNDTRPTVYIASTAFITRGNLSWNP